MFEEIDVVKGGRGASSGVAANNVFFLPTHKKYEHLLVDRYSNPSKEVSYL